MEIFYVMNLGFYMTVGL